MRTTTGGSRTADPCVVLGRAAARLATAGRTVDATAGYLRSDLRADGLSEAPADALADVLTDVVRDLRLRSAVLRSAAGDVLAVAGEIVHAVPSAPTGPVSVVELPVPASPSPIATMTVVGAGPADLPLLRALSAVLGLALASPRADRLPLALLEACDADSSAAADALHDGPVQDLVAARLVAEAAVRGADVAVARDALQTALASLRRALWFLRPRGADDGGLAPALEQLSGRLVEAGRPALLLHLEPAASALLAPHAASVTYRLVQSLAAPGGQRPTSVLVHRVSGGVRVAVEAHQALSGPERWAARARALGGSLTTTTNGAVLTVPCDLRGPLAANPPTTPARRST